jgi:hypothetical protein
VLVLALVVMLVLSIAAVTTLYLSQSGSQTATRTNAAQSAYALAESGVNNAVAMLYANYPGTVTYPGDSNLLPARTTTYSNGTARWSGVLQQVTDQTWRWQWAITSVGTISHPTSSTTTVTSTAKAIVPVVIATQQNIGSTGTLNWLYADHDLSLAQSIRVGSPICVDNNFTLANSAQVLAAANAVVVGGSPHPGGGNLQINNSASIASSSARIAAVHVAGTCNSAACGTPSWDCHSVYATTHDDTIPSGLVTTPTLTCSTGTSTMGFWYQNTDLGPNSQCDAATKTGTPPTVDTGDNTVNGNAYSTSLPFDLTPSQSYTCREIIEGQTLGELSWNSASGILTMKGTIFIDGSGRCAAGERATRATRR